MFVRKELMLIAEMILYIQQVEIDLNAYK